MKASNLLTLVLSSTASTLIGYPITSKSPCFASRPTVMLKVPVYDPNCSACRDGATPPKCYVSESSWLTALANCVDATCTDFAPWKLEKYRTERATGRFTDFHDCVYALLSLDDFASANIIPDSRKSNSELFLEVGAFFVREYVRCEDKWGHRTYMYAVYFLARGLPVHRGCVGARRVFDIVPDRLIPSLNQLQAAMKEN
jgi:hypothetical protein